MMTDDEARKTLTMLKENLPKLKERFPNGAWTKDPVTGERIDCLSHETDEFIERMLLLISTRN